MNKDNWENLKAFTRGMHQSSTQFSDNRSRGVEWATQMILDRMAKFEKDFPVKDGEEDE